MRYSSTQYSTAVVGVSLHSNETRRYPCDLHNTRVSSAVPPFHPRTWRRRPTETEHLAVDYFRHWEAARHPPLGRCCGPSTTDLPHARGARPTQLWRSSMQASRHCDLRDNANNSIKTAYTQFSCFKRERGPSRASCVSHHHRIEASWKKKNNFRSTKKIIKKQNNKKSWGGPVVGSWALN